jgi:acetolactate synthase-1/2/3 large subunit
VEKNGVHLVLTAMREAGVDAIFGVPGGAIAPFLQDLRSRDDIRTVFAAHESGAAFMADGYARSSGKLGVCLTTTGPGVTNAVTGVASAHLDNVPLMLISGQTPPAQVGSSAFQESTGECGVDTTQLMSTSTKYSAAVSHPEALPRVIAKAVNVALSDTPGAVHVSIPRDVARAPQEADIRPRLQLGTSFPSTDDMKEVHELVTSARHPLIYLGVGARSLLKDQLPAFTRYVEENNIPVVTTLQAKGIFPESHPLSLGIYGLAGHAAAQSYAKDADLVLVAGTRLGEWATGGRAAALVEDKKIVHVDSEAVSFDQAISADMNMKCDVRAFFEVLFELNEEHPPSDISRSVPTDTGYEAAPDEHGCDSISPSALIRMVNSVIDADLDIFVDIGNCTGLSVRHLQIDPPARVFIPTGLASMGWSCGAAIGGKIASPKRRSLAIVGDGAFLMNGNEVATAARYGVGVVYLVLDDGYYGMVNHGESFQSGAPLTENFYRTGFEDTALFAEALGADTLCPDSVEEAEKALRLAFERADHCRRPQVVIAAVNPLEAPPYGDRFEMVGR